MLDAADASERWDADRGYRITAWTGACVAATSQFMYVVDSGLVALSLPEIEREFGDVPRSTIGWVAGAFLIAQSSLLLVGGRLGDRYGRKRFFLFGMSVFSLGALLTALAPTIWLLLAARVLQGFGAAFLTSGALALALAMFPTFKSAVVVGTWGAIGSLAAWLTPTAGSLVVERDWRVGFLLVVPIGLAAVVVGWRVLVEQPVDRSRGPTDRLGYVLGPPALGLLMLVLSRGGTWGWHSAQTLLLGALVIALLAAFAWRSTVATSPLLDLEIVRNRRFAANVVAGMFSQMGFYGWFLTAPIVMSGMWGWSIREIGFALALGQVLASVGSPLGGQLVVRFGPTTPIVLGALCCGFGMIWLVSTISSTADFWSGYLPMALLLGFGGGMCGTVTTGAALAALPPQMLGAGNSVQQLVRRMGGALGVAFAVALLGEASGPGLLAGARRAWLFVALIHFAMLIPAFVPRQRAR